MSYKLKTTGLATHCKMCIAVDPDTNSIKDFASTSVTSTMSIGGGITISEQAWDGNTRKYFKLATGSYVAFGTNKPFFECQASHQFQSVVWIGEVAGAQPVVFGYNSASYFCGNDQASGGNRHPTAALASNYLTGNGNQLSNGSKRIFGWSLSRNGVTNATFNYSAADTAASGTVQTFTLSAGTYYYLDYVGRSNSSSTQQDDKIHAILMFDNAITQSDFDSLRDDWFGVLLEQEVTNPTGEYQITTEGITFSGGATSSSIGSYQITTEDSAFSGGATSIQFGGLYAITTEDTTFAGGGTGQQVSGTINVLEIRDLTTGNLRVNETGITAVISSSSTGTLAIRKTGLTTNSSGNCAITDFAVIVGNSYRVTLIMSDGSEGTGVFTAG